MPSAGIVSDDQIVMRRYLARALLANSRVVLNPAISMEIWHKVIPTQNRGKIFRAFAARRAGVAFRS
ncbi:MAG: hypothetical protein DWI25_02945 [Planctomycetota bacterium]|nr:MAG: hypothetical protein DWI25_02945 [Planctomycetota bacterium]